MTDRKRSLEDAGDSESPKRAKIASSSSSVPSFLPAKGDLAKPPSKPINPALAKANAIAAKLAKLNPTLAKARQQEFAAPLAPPRPDVAEMAKRVAAARAKVEGMAPKSSNPYLAGSSLPSRPSTSSTRASEPAPPRQAAGIHPLLMGLDKPSIAVTSKNRYKPMLPKFASTSANTRIVQAQPIKKVVQQIELKERGPTLEEAKKDPYFDRRLGVESLQPRNKKGRAQIRFVQKGRYVKEGETKRQEAKMEALKAKIAEAARKAGIEDEMEDGALNRKVKRQPPPAVEWWDAAFVQGESYDDLDLPDAHLIWESACQDLIQHPIAIPSPSDRKEIKSMPLALTKKEQKKKRRQERAATMKDHQDRVKMGLEPPDPPKIKLSNMMRVLTQEAVADPTKIEARVKREMMARRNQHERANADRKLTDEQRREKVEVKAKEEESKGIHAAAFRIKHLTNIGHKIKVRKNADQLYLTGVMLLMPKFALVIVEGSSASLKKYKRLMQHRIDWTEEAIVTETSKDDDVDGPPKEVISLADNSCTLVWEGEERERMFKNGFREKVVPSDHMAREFLGPRAEGIFDQARKGLDAEIIGH